jgi:membrane fusion protein, multidrug efflux system
MKKFPILAILGLVIFIGVLAGIKGMQIRAMIEQGKKFVLPPEPVTTAVVEADSWQTTLKAVGTLTAVQGVTVSAELSGKVVKIAFEPGTLVKEGDLLICQDTSTEEAQLLGAEAQTNLARIDRDRASKMVAENIISQADYDGAVAAYQQAKSQADNIRAAIAKKTIRAPFSGHLGIRQVNLGQIIREGDPIVTLQTLDPIYVDFNLPQQFLEQLSAGLPVTVTCDALPDVTIQGTITTINPLVDSKTRNIQLQATVPNHDNKLRSGMFVTTSVDLPTLEKVLAIPETAVLYAPYGNSVFIVENDKDHEEGKIVRQQFVRLGKKRGDFVAVTSGLNEGQTVVSTGGFKLHNDQAVVIDNKLSPTFELSPTPENK